ncbi:MAG: hypothetical protein RL141_792 [Candidatus Parcubacteria bacterium]|jgi:hypothetical protein
MNIKTLDARTFAIGAVAVGLAVGTVLGFANIATTQVTKAEEAPAANTSIGLGLIDRNVSPERIDSAKAVVGNVARTLAKSDVSTEFKKVSINPYISERDAVRGVDLHKKAVLVINDDKGYTYWIDGDTNKVVQIGPASREKESDANLADSYDFTERYTKDTLLPVAVEFAKSQGADASLLAGKPQIGTKDGKAFFYRWESSSIGENMRFVQVGLTVGGTLLSYSNTVGI